MKHRKPSKLEQGVLVGAAFIATDHGEPGLAADMLRCLGMNSLNISGIDQYDKDRLRCLAGERGIDLVFDRRSANQGGAAT